MDEKARSRFLFILSAAAVLIYAFAVGLLFRADLLQKAAKGLKDHPGEGVEVMWKSLRTDPQNAGAWSNLGDLYWLEARQKGTTEQQQLENLKKAEAAYLNAVAREPIRSSFHLNLGLVRYEIAKLQGYPPGPTIEQSLRLAVELDPLGYYPHYLLGDFLLIQGHQEEAFQELRKAIQANPKDEVIKAILEMAMRQTTKYAELLQVIPEDVALAHLYFATMLQEKLNRWNECKMEFEKILELEPKNTYYRDYYLSYCMSLGDIPAAVQEVQERTEILGEDPHVLYKLADFLKNRGEFEQAMQVCERIQKHFPGFSDAVRLMGEIRAQQGNLIEAARTYEDYIRTNPKDPDGYLGLARLYRDHGNPYKAAELFSKAGLLAPEQYGVQYALADAYVKVGMYDRALEALSQCKRIDPEDVKAHLMAGRIYLERKDWMEAAREFNEVLKRRPDHQEALTGFLKAQAHIP